ncbi:hypothetical protein BJ138DRAFT_1151641 [Hygrophoropsis aurantiaca]|uniref:Uncharacterized protein n=1 Tax=Hygrophoropsis aurantiaca TaxID=72124 RepID=A0ACB8AD30_9AGAM|nr:hypothetical protein BJ138DRAFT_1151641 [Hygrophoropsis aurantiaca]
MRFFSMISSHSTLWFLACFCGSYLWWSYHQFACVAWFIEDVHKRIAAVASIVILCAIIRAIGPQIEYIWRCFIRPIGQADRKTRLEKVLTFSRHSDIFSQNNGVVLSGSSRCL